MGRAWALVVTLLLGACDGPRDSAEAVPAGTGIRFLGGEGADGFARALAPREFVFPLDHASHPEFRTEWWYFTGNLATPAGRHFGFELTFFRYGLEPPSARPAGSSAWRTNEAWMAHLAVTDTEGTRFLSAERFGRGALGLAGVVADPWRVWVKDWAASGTASSDTFRVSLTAADEQMAIDLALDSAVPPVAHGDDGLDRKGNAAGNASYYYSIPRLNAHGSIGVEGVTYEVDGLAWLDREWSTSALEPGVVGWDWFGLRLADGASLMYYRLRTAAGVASPLSGGSLVSASGGRRTLIARDVELTPVRWWVSQATGVRYPVEWELRVPSAGLELLVSPLLDAQELDLSVRYWEGAVRVRDLRGRDSPAGEGYVELAGY